jgi:DNA polymerase-3 subunit delta'
MRLAEATSTDAGQVQSVLLYGPGRAAQAELADALAQAWLCTKPGADGACGECQSCLAAANRRHVDLLKIEPQPPSHIIRLASISSGGASGELSVQEFFRTFPMMGRNKVVVMLDADRMNGDAANSFLKTLEEPPTLARIVLTAPAPSRLLPTILSRCLAVACELPSPEEFASTASAWGELAFFLEGSPERAESYANVKEVYRGILQLAQRTLRAEPSEALALSDTLRELAEAWEKRQSHGMRAAQAEVLAGYALALRELGMTGAVPLVAEAHRRLLGNGSAGLVFDALASELSRTTQ